MLFQTDLLIFQVREMALRMTSTCPGSQAILLLFCEGRVQIRVFLPIPRKEAGDKDGGGLDKGDGVGSGVLEEIRKSDLEEFRK